MELDYIDRRSLWLDLKIRAKTAVVLLKGTGVYGMGRKAEIERKDIIPGSEKNSSEDFFVSLVDSAEKWQSHRKSALFYLENRL